MKKVFLFATLILLTLFSITLIHAYTYSNTYSTTNSNTCQENWQCYSWSSCQNGEMFRDCYDRNKCGTINEQPLQIMYCDNYNNDYYNNYYHCSTAYCRQLNFELRASQDYQNMYNYMNQINQPKQPIQVINVQTPTDNKLTNPSQNYNINNTLIIIGVIILAILILIVLVLIIAVALRR